MKTVQWHQLLRLQQHREARARTHWLQQRSMRLACSAQLEAANQAVRAAQRHGRMLLDEACGRVLRGPVDPDELQALEVLGGQVAEQLAAQRHHAASLEAGLRLAVGAETAAQSALRASSQRTLRAQRLLQQLRASDRRQRQLDEEQAAEDAWLPRRERGA